MAQIKRRRGKVQVSLADFEREALLSVVLHLREHVGSAIAAGQKAYEDDDKQAEYVRWVEPEIAIARDGDIDTIREDLENGEDHVLLPEPRAFAWLRGLNHLRLAAAATIGADQEGWELPARGHEPETPEFRMFLLLSYLTEELIVSLSS